MLGKRGMINYFFYFMIAVCMFIIGTSLASALINSSTTARADAGLNCSSTTDTSLKTGCTTIDLVTPIFIGLVIAIAGTVVVGRFV